MTPDINNPETPLQPSTIAKYVNLNKCERYFNIALDPQTNIEDELDRDKNAFYEAFRQSQAVQKKAGDDFEVDVLNSLVEVADSTIRLDELHESPPGGERVDPPLLTQAVLQSILTDVLEDGVEKVWLLYQPAFRGAIEPWQVRGDADLIFVDSRGPSVTFHIIDVKMSTEEQTHHQIQTACYSLLLEGVLTSLEIGTTNFQIKTGVLTPDTVLDEIRVQDLPTFDRQPRESDIVRLLQEGGTFEQLTGQTLSETTYTVDSKCSGCPYSEVCLTQSLETTGIELLGLPQSLQQTLKDHGVTTLHDVAGLGEVPENISPTDYHDDAELKRTSDTYDELTSKPGGADNLAEYVVQAQTLLGEFDKETYHSTPGHTTEWIPRSGESQLPADDLPDGIPAEDHLQFEPGTLIRIYLNVQHDNARDRIIGLGATVDATKADNTPLTVSHVDTEIPDDESEAAETERNLLEGFFDELTTTIKAARATIDLNNSTYDAVPLHFYVYTEEEETVLLDGLERHSRPPQTLPETTTNGNAGHDSSAEPVAVATRYRDLLSHREGIDEPILSVVKQEIQQRHAIRTPTAGLIQVADQFQPFSSELSMKSPTSWVYEPEDPSRLPDGQTSVDLRDVFSFRFFNYDTPYVQDSDGTPSILLGDSKQNPDGWLANRYRTGAQIPLAYIWSAVGRIDDNWVADITDDTDSGLPITPFRYHSIQKETKIAPEDIEALIDHLSDALLRIERSIGYKSWNHSKTPTPISTLSQGNPESTPTLAEGCLEYLGLEYTASRSEAQTHYTKQPRERLQNGESLVFKVTGFEKQPGSGRKLLVKGDLAYEDIGNISDPDKYRDAIRAKGADGSGSGDYMSVTPVDGNRAYEEQSAAWNPRMLEKGMTAQVLDLNVGAETNPEIVLELHQPYQGDDDEENGQLETFSTDSWYYSVDSETGGKSYYIQEGRYFLLDPKPDDIIAEQVAEVLQHTDNLDAYQLFERLRHGVETDPETTLFEDSAVREFVDWQTDWATEHPDNDYGIVPPNQAQEAFITETTGEISLLHGAPGTGKTNGALGPGIAARLYSGSLTNTQIRGFVTGPSNKAIDEALEEVANAVNAHKTAGGDAFANTRLVRLCGSDKPPEAEQIPGVSYVSMQKPDPDAGEFREIGKRLFKESYQDTDEHVVIFATPSRAWFDTNKFPLEDYANHSELLEADVTAYNLLVADEASMMGLPRFFLASTLYERGGQIIISGDHRQMPPVNQHNWHEERRPSITALAPYLSTLDYCRLLRGDDVDAISDEFRDNVQVSIDYLDRDRLGIPITRLPQSYRSHQVMCDFLREHVYETDDLEYFSEKTETITPTTGETSGRDTALSAEQPITLITYDSQASQQSNRVEQAIIQALVKDIPTTETTGVVTPHNAQRGVIDRGLDSLPQETRPPTTVDTVERFQGGERDVMIMSGTVSDPDFIDAESRFLLNLNRVNVAVSRMKKKLVVVAARSIFEHIPNDTEEYEHTKLWKGLAAESGILRGDADPSWGGDLEAFTGLSTENLPRNPTVEVYGISARNEYGIGAQVRPLSNSSEE